MPTKSDVIHETGEFYGTMPEDPPAKLPAGSQSMGQHGEPMDMSGWVLNRDSEYYWNASRVVYQDPANQLRWNPVSFVNWTTVRKSAPSPLPEFRVGDEVTGTTEPKYGAEHRSGTITRFMDENYQGAPAVLVELRLSPGMFTLVTRSSLRPAPHPVESIPHDVAELLKEARKYRPECVVEVTVDDIARFFIHRSNGKPWAVIQDAAMFARNADKDAFKKGAQGMSKAGPGLLPKALAENRVWPREDARRMVESEKTPSGGASGQSKADPYRQGALQPAALEAHMAVKNAAYRSRVAAVLADIDRTSVTHDKMGRPIARWTGWTSTRWAK